MDVCFLQKLREAAKKVIFFSGPASTKGWGGAGHKGKQTFLIYLYILAKKLWRIFFVNPFPAILRRKKIPMVTKPRGGGGKGLSGRVTKKITFFCGFPNPGG